MQSFAMTECVYLIPTSAPVPTMTLLQEQQNKTNHLNEKMKKYYTSYSSSPNALCQSKSEYH